MTVDWDLLIRYLAGTCRDEERQRFEQWLAEAPEHRAVLQGARDMVTQARHEVPAGRAAELLASLRRDISAAESSGMRPPALRVVRAARPVITFPLSARRFTGLARFKIAAAVLVVLGGVGLWAARSKTDTGTEAVAASPFREVVTARGQRLALQLPDGSAVMLAPGSRLRVPADYGVRERMVSLVGEGAFTVTHDAARPFSVRTARGVVKDIGTQFVVREYEGEAETEVVVAEGEVELSGRAGNGGQGTLLKRGQLGRLEASGDVSVRSGVDLDRYFAWTEGRLIFRDTPLHEAVAQIGRWYDVQIRLVPDTVARRHLTAVVQDEPIDDVLRMIAASLDLELERSDAGRIYTLRAR